MDAVYCRQCKQPIGATDPFCKLCGASQRPGVKASVPQIVFMQPERSSIHIVVSIACLTIVLICGAAGYIYVQNSDIMNPNHGDKTAAKTLAPPPSATIPATTGYSKQLAQQDIQQRNDSSYVQQSNPFTPSDQAQQLEAKKEQRRQEFERLYQSLAIRIQQNEERQGTLRADIDIAEINIQKFNYSGADAHENPYYNVKSNKMLELASTLRERISLDDELKALYAQYPDIVH